MAHKDYYTTLGVSRDASADEIKAAYRKLAKQYHPDRNPGDKSSEEKFKEVQEAYDALGDENKRSQYDRMRDGGFRGFGPQGFEDAAAAGAILNMPLDRSGLGERVLRFGPCAPAIARCAVWP